MTYQEVARLALTAVCTLQGVAQLAIDLNRTHATNPEWIGHARFHVVWQSISVGLLALIEVVLIWAPGIASPMTFYLAAILTLVLPCGFLGAFGSRQLYSGRLSDPNGIPALRMRVMGQMRSIDMNLVAVIVAFVAVAIILLIFRA